MSLRLAVALLVAAHQAAGQFVIAGAPPCAVVFSSIPIYCASLTGYERARAGLY